jgi:SAM-dependent methyltransferase
MSKQNYSPRLVKAHKIATILKDMNQTDLSVSFILDIGCGDGTITYKLAENVKKIIGIEIDANLIRDAKINNPSNSFFLQGDGEDLPFPNESFDIIICAQVYEHTKDPYLLIEEIRRVLRSGGICFFSGPNKLAVMEEHFWLPFLSWLPQRLADLYMRLSGKGRRYDVRPLTYWKLRRLWKKFKIIDYNPTLAHEPNHYGVSDEIGHWHFISKVPLKTWQYLPFLFPNFNWILVKP